MVPSRSLRFMINIRDNCGAVFWCDDRKTTNMRGRLHLESPFPSDKVMKQESFLRGLLHLAHDINDGLFFATPTASGKSRNLVGPPANAGIPLQPFVSYSIEFSSFSDFAGNLSHPNEFSNNLLDNLAKFTGNKPLIRVGGNTQDFAVFDNSLSTALVGIVDPPKSPDYPTTITIGPAYFESYLTWPDTHFVHGFNLGKNSTEACPDLATDENYKYYASSFAGTGGNGLDPLLAWDAGLDADKDIALISSHNYISGANVPGVTLQGTLMNHKSTVASIAKQLNSSRLIAALLDSLQPDLRLILGETNSLYNQGRPGLSNTFGATLWGVDFNLWCAANDIKRVHMHQGTNYRYQSWQPVDTNITSKGTKAPYYGNIAVAAFLGDLDSPEQLPQIVNMALPSKREAVYASYVQGKLSKIIVINLDEYNATAGNEFVNDYERPVKHYSFQLPHGIKGHFGVQRLSANGSDAITRVTFDGYS